MKYLKFLIPISLIILFIFIRFYNIKDGLFFFNDMGRDLLVLQKWQETGKPPLLGPQTSVMPFNQSAIFYYFLYPFYFLAKGSPLSALLANAFLYLSIYITGLFIFKKNKQISNIINICFFLICIHPQYIIQNRFIWNPSLITPLIFISIFSFYLLINQYSKIKLWIFSLSIVSAISISYSTIPIFLSIFLYWLIFNRKKFYPIFLSFISSLIILNFPTIIFELRHNFLLTKSIFIKKLTDTTGSSIINKFSNLSNFTVNLSTPSLNFYLLIFFILLSIIIFIKNYKHRNLDFFVSFLFFFTLIFYFILPVPIHSHYIFPLASALFLLITSLPLIPKAIIILMLTWIYLSPSNISSHFKNAPRTYGQMNKCFAQICPNIKDPIFVSTQSNFHTFHNGPEHRYLLKKNNCNVVNIEDNNQLADKMALVVDGGEFDKEKSKFYELDLFGPFKIIDTYSCQENFTIHILQKDTKNNTPATCGELIKENSLTETKNFFWLNENKEIEYIKGFSIYLENKELEKYYKQCLKENFKCHLLLDSLVCGKEIQKDENAQIVLDLYKQNYPKESDFEPSRTIDIIKKVDNFIDVSFGENGSGVRSLMKWEENKWKTLKISQEGLFCEDMKKYNIPAVFFRKNICYSHEENAYYKYNEISQKWEPTNEKDY